MNNLTLRMSQIISILDQEDALVKGVVERFFVGNNLDIKWLEAALKTPEGIDRLESFVAKFSRMQDMFTDKLLPLFLKHSGEIPKTAIDNLHRLEQLGIIDDTEAWVDMRLLRNQLIHEYVADNKQLLEHLLLAKKFSVDLSQSFAKLKTLIQI